MLPANLMTRSLALAALLTTGAVQAQVVMYTDPDAFHAALTTRDWDFFDDLQPGLQGVPNLNRQTLGGQFSYTVSGQLNGGPDELYVVGVQDSHWISTNINTATIFLGGFTPGVTAVAIFASTFDDPNVPTPGFQMSVSACPVDVNAACVGDSYITAYGPSDFRGFISMDGFRYLTASSGSGYWPAITTVALGVAAVPEPGTYALMAAGLLGVGWVARRRRTA